MSRESALRRGMHKTGCAEAVARFAFASAVLAAALSTSVARACDAGPNYCTDDPRIPSALAAKKQDLVRQGYPSRLVGLLDIGVQCVARIETEPGGFRLIDVASDGSKTDVSWDDDEERIAKDNLTSGRSVRYWIVNSRRAFSCYGQPPYNQQSDYVATDDLNSNAAIKCTLQGRGVNCSR